MHFLYVCLLTLAPTLAIAKDGEDDGPNHGHSNGIRFHTLSDQTSSNHSLSDDISAHHVSFSLTTIYSSKTPIATISLPVFEDNPSRTNDDHPYTGAVTPTFEDNPAKTNDDHPHYTITPGAPIITLSLPVVTPSPIDDHPKPGAGNGTTIRGSEDNTKSGTDDDNSTKLATPATTSQSDATAGLVTGTVLSTSSVSSATVSTSSSTVVPANAAGYVNVSRIVWVMGIFAAITWVVQRAWIESVARDVMLISFGFKIS